MPRRHTTEADYQRRLLRAQQVLQERLDEPVDPTALARVANFSLHHFHRIFRAQMGETVMEHVRRLRLERAARRLRADGDVRLLEVALDAGYESHEAFTRAFIARFGVPPSEFREQPASRVLDWQQAHAGGPGVEVRVRTHPALRVAFMRHRGSYADVGQLWQRLMTWAARHGFLGSEPVLYGVCPDDPAVTPEALLRFDACVAVAEDFAATDEVEVMTLPGGTYAVGLHRGSYARLGETYLEVIGRWFPTSGYEPAPDAVIEHYLNDPERTPEEDLLTEVRVRIAD
ncbi:AraC family transcriptional regulator [Pyxidicoccus fallax]|uniref:AraC family transcriptional regulator n=1 Tax=Pyxidicoccus fallax TaxID=394095 RepID=A0A848LGF3_9BACT|nr:AraC family transcriptional regulator [Pyxidicoccus fallax]NMO15681.1 AraC family transcriptional regulator [Pyxidicoccus fallax]NPC77088.1 AraC family transcriptional regulator [Pyxidicoccus fallax]